MNRNRIILSGGGTGGHIYPAISIANELLFRDKNSEILFVGANNKMEMNIVPKYGFDILGLWISGFNRTNFLKNILVPLKLLISIFQSLIIIKRFKPNIVIGTGGYASGPIMYVANLLNIPTLIQEQNSYPGVTNKLLSKKVNKVCVAYENLEKYFPKNIHKHSFVIYYIQNHQMSLHVHQKLHPLCFQVLICFHNFLMLQYKLHAFCND